MGNVTVAASFNPGPGFIPMLRSCRGSALVQEVIVVTTATHRVDIPCRVITGSLVAQATITAILESAGTAYLLLLPAHKEISLTAEALTRMVEEAEATGAGLVYSDYYDETARGMVLHPLNDYQLGSVRDDFNFGAVMLFSMDAVRKALKKHGGIPPVHFAGLYDLRLKVSIDHSIHRIAAPLYSVRSGDDQPGDTKLFAYVDPKNENVQKEMESVFTDYLKKTGAYLPPESLKPVEGQAGVYPVEASVIIPVRNRRGTVADAVMSALSQKTGFPFNVIVVDNHSTDGTTEILAGLAAQHPALKHIIPEKTDLGIGGCWNEALYSDMCGRYAVQLDSDDLYIDTDVLRKIVSKLREGSHAMVVGSYTLVNERMDEIPPGLVDHREWTDGNGHNNALRINGLGAPRAFDTGVMRSIGFLNVNYGEDYAAALRICREYRIGRIFESLYLCRRWPGNTDASLSVEAANRNDAFKDTIRTEEIIARKLKAGICVDE